MNRKRKVIAYAVMLLFVLWAIFPWIVPAYNHNLVLSVKLLTGDVPTYEVRLQNLAPWPTTLTDAHWMVRHNRIYEYWVPSEPPRQVLVLLPLQSHAFKFVIYNEATDTMRREYYHGALALELSATIHILGASSPFRVLASYCDMSS